MMLASTWTGLVLGSEPASAQEAPLTIPGLLGEYFHNNNLTEPAFERVDPILNFAWGRDTPDPRLDPETFSVRWTGYITVPTSGNYTLVTKADDWLRVYVDGELAIDAWEVHCCDWASTTVSLVGGHPVPIRLEYAEDFGDASMLFAWDQDGAIVPVPASALSTDPGLLATYHADQTLSNPVSRRVEATVDHDWEAGGPDAPVGTDGFSVQWTGFVTAPTTGAYTFYTRSDDGARVKIANHTVLDDWKMQAANADHPSSVVHLTAGVPAPIVIEYFEAMGGASMTLKWSGPGVPTAVMPASALRPALVAELPSGSPPAIGVHATVVTSASDVSGATVTYSGFDSAAPLTCTPASGAWFAVGTTPVTCTATDTSGNQASTHFAVHVTPVHGLLGEYFHDNDLTEPAFERIDHHVAFDWALEAPDARMHVDNFSVRWTGHVTPQATGNYTFHASADGSVRVLIGTSEFAQTACCAGVSSGPIPLTAGTATPIRIVYAEQDGAASVSLEWSAPGISRQPVPSSAFSTPLGLLATYYADPALSHLVARGLDPQIDHEWGLGGPTASVGSDHFSIRWSGFVIAPTTGTYTFYTRSNDGARVSIAGDNVLDAWSSGEGDTERASSPVHLSAGTPTQITVEHHEETGNASMQLKWSGPDMPKHVVPPTAFVPALQPREAMPIQIDAGGWHNCALFETGNIHCWGEKADGRATEYTGGDAIQVSAGHFHTCAVLQSGNIDCWGWNGSGQSNDYDGGDAIQVSTAPYHTCAVLENSNIHCWGYTGYDATTAYGGGDAIQVSAAEFHTCALLESGNIDCWGWNGYGQVNDYTGGDAIQVSAGTYHTCAVLEDGNVDCWGDNGYGQSSDYTGGNAIDVSASLYHTCAVLEDGNIDCWGDNYAGQATDQTGRGAVHVTAGIGHTCAATGNGRAFCWGDDWSGQLRPTYDQIRPSLEAHENVVLETTGPAGAPLTYDAPTGSSPVTCTPAAGTIYPAGTLQVTCTAIDPWGQTATRFFAIRVTPDTTAPVTTIRLEGTPGSNGWFTSPVDVTLTCTDTGSGCDRSHYLLDGLAWHRGNGFTVISQGNTTLDQFYSVDGLGNVEVAQVGPAILIDMEPPVIIPHDDETHEATGPEGANVSYTPPRWTDIAADGGNASCLPASGDAFPFGTTTVTCTAQDPAGHQAEATSFTISVVDTTPPVIAAAPDLTHEATAYGGATINYTAPAWADLVDGAGTATCAPASGTFVPMGDTTIACAAIDAAGNVANATTFNVTAVPGPVATVGVAPENRTVNLVQPSDFSAAGFDQYGNPTGGSPVWAAEGGTVDANGTYIASSVGAWEINATIQNVTGAAVVHVTDQLRLDVQTDAPQYSPAAALNNGVYGTVLVRFWDGTPLANATIDVTITRTLAGVDVDSATVMVTSAPDGTARFRVPDTHALMSSYRIDAATVWSGNSGQATSTYVVV